MSVLRNFLIAQDQAFNCIIKLKDGYGTPDETLSARAWRMREEHPKLYKCIDKLFFWQSEHCKSSFISEMQRKHLPVSYRTPEITIVTNLD